MSDKPDHPGTYAGDLWPPSFDEATHVWHSGQWHELPLSIEGVMRKMSARIEQLEAEVKKYAMDSLLATDGNLMLHEENQRLRAALRVAAHELELLYFFAISNGIAEAGVPPHVAARAALGERT